MLHIIYYNIIVKPFLRNIIFNTNIIVITEKLFVRTLNYIGYRYINIFKTNY